MPGDILVEGADELERVGRQLKELGDKGLRRELFRGFNRATKPLKEAAKDNARRVLPKRGGLNVWVATKAKVATRTRVSGDKVGVRIVGSKKGSDVAAIDRGQVRHPVYGSRKVWVTQRVHPGWFTEPVESGARAVRLVLLDVVDDVARRLERG